MQPRRSGNRGAEFTALTQPKKNGTKLRAFELCKKVYGSDLFLGPKGGLKDGRCDSVLIALYGKHFLGLTSSK